MAQPTAPVEVTTVPEVRASYLEQAFFGAAVIDLDRAVLWVNGAFARMHGYERHELGGRRMEELVAPESRTKLIEQLRRLEYGKPERFESIHVRKDGSLFALCIEATPVRDARGRIRWSAMRVLEDVGRIDNLRDRAWLMSVVGASEEALAVASLDGVMVRWSPGAEHLSGYAASEIIGQHGSVLIPCPRLSEVQALVDRVRTGGSVRGIETELVRSDATLVPISLTLAPILDEEERVTGISVIARDLSKRWRIEEQLRSGRQLLETVLDILPVGVWITDEAGRIVMCNMAAKRIWAGMPSIAPEHERVHRRWSVETGEPIEAEQSAALRALREGETSVGELVRIQAFDGTRKTIRVSAVPLRDDGGPIRGAVVVNEDVTELHRSAEALRQALAAREEILEMVSHDLRTPLNGVLLGVELLLQHLGDSFSHEELRTGLERVLRVTRNMNGLIGDLVDFVRLEKGLTLERAPASAKDLATEAVDSFRPQAAAASLDLVLDVASDLPAVCADRARILQVLSNLIGNALKFTPPGGRVGARVSAADGEVVFCVWDTGPGIPAEERARLFDRFWQGRRGVTRKEGLGLGLAIAQNIVHAHEGRIWVSDEREHGATFCFALPVRRGDAPRESS